MIYWLVVLFGCTFQKRCLDFYPSLFVLWREYPWRDVPRKGRDVASQETALAVHTSIHTQLHVCSRVFRAPTNQITRLRRLRGTDDGTPEDGRRWYGWVLWALWAAGLEARLQVPGRAFLGHQGKRRRMEQEPGEQVWPHSVLFKRWGGSNSDQRREHRRIEFQTGQNLARPETKLRILSAVAVGALNPKTSDLTRQTASFWASIR